ncbi:MAG TPA: DUF305 domain-containing protein [Longimicrobium sp.]|nr:DUF305 domain-containing protein [Longimicrobium sp.]
MKPRWITAAGLAAVLASASPDIAAAQAQTNGAQTAAQVPHTEADVRFIQGMLAHHAQALEMTGLVSGRDARQDVRLIAERIDVSQRSEMDRMQRWLQVRGLAADSADAHHAHHGGGGAHAGMPGMATPEEMARLAQASGPAFDALFLELMIRHHEGALVMVEELFGSQGGGQASEIYSIASEVDADQRMEIDRMRAMQQGPLGGARPR